MVQSRDGKTKTIKDIYDFHDWFYVATGFGGTDYPKWKQKILYKTYKWFMRFVYFIQALPLYYHVVEVRSDLHLLSVTLSFVIIATAGVIKIGLMDVNRKVLEALQKRLRANLHIPWVGKTHWEQEIKEKNKRILVQLTKYLLVLASLGMLGMIAVPLRPKSRLKFFLPFPFTSLAKSRYYVPLYILHIFTMISFIMNFMAHDMIFIGLILRLCDHLEIIEESLRKWCLPAVDHSAVERDWHCYSIPDDNSFLSPPECETPGVFRKLLLGEKKKKLVKNCIAHHQAILAELKVINSLCAVPMMVSMILGPLLVGLLAFLMLSGDVDREMKVQQTMYAVPAAAFLFTYCFFGTKIAEKFQDVRFAFYNCPWYDLDLETRKLIITVLLCSRKTGRLTAGSFSDVSLTTFLMLTKVAYNTVALLRDTN